MLKNRPAKGARRRGAPAHRAGRGGVAKVYRLVVTAVVVAAVSLVACALWGVGPLAGAGPLAGPDSAKSVSAARSATDEANSAVPRTAGPTDLSKEARSPWRP